jgi:hypothetical protein
MNEKLYNMILLNLFVTAVTLLLCGGVSAQIPEDKNQRQVYEKKILEQRLTQTKRVFDNLKLARGTDQVSLVLDFTFYADTKEDAHSLAAALSAYKRVYIRERKNGWRITGVTPQKMALDWQSAKQWIENMVSLGFAHNAVFMGFSASG